MNIRNAEKSELPFIRQQRVRAYEDHVKVLPDGHWQELKKAVTSEADTQHGVDLIVAEADGGIVGSVVLFPPKTDAYEGHVEELDYPEIRMLAVTPEARGKGAGAALIKECIRRAKERGYSEIGLHTGEFMKDAMKLYERFGFERVPQYDFIPADDGIVVQAYRLEMERSSL